LLRLRPRLSPQCTAPFNRYGECLKASQHPILGIDRDGVFLDTRTKFWELKTTGSDERTLGNTLAPLKSGSFPGDGEAFAPWTWNCLGDWLRLLGSTANRVAATR